MFCDGELEDQVNELKKRVRRYFMMALDLKLSETNFEEVITAAYGNDPEYAYLDFEIPSHRFRYERPSIWFSKE